VNRRIWLPIVAAGIFVAVSAILYGLLGGPTASPLIYGGVLVLVFAATTTAGERRLRWYTRLMIGIPVFVLVYFVVMPSIFGDPVLSGYDGTNPAVLVPDLLLITSLVVVYSCYSLVAERRIAAN
jgi:hypothetical protein